MKNIEYEKDIQKSGLLHCFYTRKDPTEVAARIKIVTDKLNDQMWTDSSQSLQYPDPDTQFTYKYNHGENNKHRLNKIVYQCFGKKNIIILNCTWWYVNLVRHGQVKIGIKQYLVQDNTTNVSNNENCDTKLWIVVLRKLKGSCNQFQDVITNILASNCVFEITQARVPGEDFTK